MEPNKVGISLKNAYAYVLLGSLNYRALGAFRVLSRLSGA